MQWFMILFSTAGHEASGTGSMKLLMNGCLLLATADGSTVEIIEEIGADNMVTYHTCIPFIVLGKFSSRFFFFFLWKMAGKNIIDATLPMVALVLYLHTAGPKPNVIALGSRPSF